MRSRAELSWPTRPADQSSRKTTDSSSVHDSVTKEIWKVSCNVVLQRDIGQKAGDRICVNNFPSALDTISAQPRANRMINVGRWFSETIRLKHLGRSYSLPKLTANKEQGFPQARVEGVDPDTQTMYDVQYIFHLLDEETAANLLSTSTSRLR